MLLTLIIAFQNMLHSLNSPIRSSHKQPFRASIKPIPPSEKRLIILYCLQPYMRSTYWANRATTVPPSHIGRHQASTPARV